MDNTEADVEIFEKAVSKFHKCEHAEHFFGQKSCSVLHHQFDNSFDVLSMCGSCRVNTSEPTTNRKYVRFS